MCLQMHCFAAAFAVSLALIPNYTASAASLAADGSESCQLLLKHAQATEGTACSVMSIRAALLGKIGGGDR